MAERKIQDIKATYGEILGMADELPKDVVQLAIGRFYNSSVDSLSNASGSDYARFKVTDEDKWDDDSYDVGSLKPKMGALLARLEQEFDFRKPSRGEHRAAPMIMTVHNNNQLSITITPIQEVVRTIDDKDLRADVEALNAIIEGDKNKAQASSLLNTIQQKSWEVFIAVLPVVLERLGR